MKKTLLATAIPAMLFVSAASATELYSDDINTLTVGGHISAGLVGSDEDSTNVNSVSPRINFGVTRDLGNGFTADGLVEWSINMENGGENALSTRLGYVGLGHEAYGRVAAGIQWAPTYDVAGVADMPIAFANEFLYDDMSMGGARADNMVSYRNSFAFDNDMSLNLGLGVQGSQDADYHSRYQAALSFDVSEYSLGLAYNMGDKQFDGKIENATIMTVSGKYGTYGQGLYVAAVYGENKFTEYKKGTDIEALVAYAFENSVNVSVNYEESKNDTDNEVVRNTTAIQVEYNFLSNVVGYAGYQIDLGDDVNANKDNMWMIGGRIYL